MKELLRDPALIDVRRFGAAYWIMIFCAPIYLVLIASADPSVHLFVSRTITVLPPALMTFSYLITFGLLHLRSNRPEPDRKAIPNLIVGGAITLLLYLVVEFTFLVHESRNS